MTNTDTSVVASPAQVEAATPWRRQVALFLSGQTASLFGSMLVQYAIMWHLTLETGSGLVLALAGVFGFLPQAVVSVFGGVWADRMNRKLLLVAADASIAASTLGLALLMLAGHDGLWLVYATLAVRSVGAGIQMPAVSAMVPQITPGDQLMRVNGINATIQSAMMLVAPALAAVVYANLSIIGIFLVDVVTAVIGIGLVLLVRVPTVERTEEPASYFGDLVAGVRYIAGHEFIRWLLLLFAMVYVLAAAPSSLMPLLVTRRFGDDVWLLAAVELAFSVGMLAAGLLISVWAGSRNRVAMIVVTSIAFGVFTLGTGLSPNVWVLAAFMFAVGFNVPYFSTPSMTLIQESVEPGMQGRVFGFMGIVMALAMPLGVGIFGPLADRFEVQTLLVVAGSLMLAVAVAAVTLPAGRRAMARPVYGRE